MTLDELRVPVAAQGVGERTRPETATVYLATRVRCDSRSPPSMHGRPIPHSRRGTVVEFVKDAARLKHQVGTPRKLEIRLHKLRDAPDGQARTVYLDGAAGVFTHRSPADRPAAPGDVTPLTLYLALRNHAARSPLVGWPQVTGAVLKVLLRSCPPDTKGPSPTTIRRAIEQIILDEPCWLHSSRSGAGATAAVVFALANSDGSPWIESDGTDPPVMPSDEEAGK